MQAMTSYRSAQAPYVSTFEVLDRLLFPRAGHRGKQPSAPLEDP
jgi:hypothetical protein